MIIKNYDNTIIAYFKNEVDFEKGKKYLTKQNIKFSLIETELKTTNIARIKTEPLSLEQIQKIEKN